MFIEYIMIKKFLEYHTSLYDRFSTFLTDNLKLCKTKFNKDLKKEVEKKEENKEVVSDEKKS